jgi:hypothetical protein
MSSNSSKNLLTANELRFHKRLHWQPNKGSWKKSREETDRTGNRSLGGYLF